VSVFAHALPPSQQAYYVSKGIQLVKGVLAKEIQGGPDGKVGGPHTPACCWLLDIFQLYFPCQRSVHTQEVRGRFLGATAGLGHQCYGDTLRSKRCMHMQYRHGRR
jgi:hypothetical protein